MDVQLYEEVKDGRRIITLDLPKKIKPADLMKGMVYEFTFNSSKASLSKKIIEFLKKEMEMDAIYQFELTNLELMDVDSDTGSSTESEEE